MCLNRAYDMIGDSMGHLFAKLEERVLELSYVVDSLCSGTFQRYSFFIIWDVWDNRLNRMSRLITSHNFKMGPC